MNSNFAKMKNMFVFKPLRLKICIVGSVISALVMLVSIFLPAVNLSITSTSSILPLRIDVPFSVWDIAFSQSVSLNVMMGMQLSVEKVNNLFLMFKGACGIIAGFVFILCLVIGLAMIVLKILDDKLVCRIVSVSCAGVASLLSIILIVKLSEVRNLFSLYTGYGSSSSSIDIGIGAILLLLSSLAMAGFTAIGIKYPAGVGSVPTRGGYNSGVAGARLVTSVVPGEQFASQQSGSSAVQPTVSLQSAANAGSINDDPPTNRLTGGIEGVKGQYAGMRIAIKPNEKMIIGRDPAACNLVVDSKNRDISRIHCTIKYEQYENCYRVVDMSSNGTFANGTPLPKNGSVKLESGTLLSLGTGENSFRLT